jgi:hypothetical protein
MAFAHDDAVDLYEKTFGKKAMISKQEAAIFFSCSTRTIDRKFFGKYVQAPGGLRIPKSAVISAINY